MKVFVYWNLHKGCYSVKNLATGRVIAHAGTVTLTNAVFKVSEAGRQRVIKERRKNVHAGVVGTLTSIGFYTLQNRCVLPDAVRNAPALPFFDPDLYQVGFATYNPYAYDSFRQFHNREMPVHSADFVRLGDLCNQSGGGKKVIITYQKKVAS